MSEADRPGATLSSAVAEEIRVVMARKMMRQSELAARLGISDMSVSRKIRGKQPIDLDELQQIADALEVSIYDLLPRRDELDELEEEEASYAPRRRRYAPLRGGSKLHYPPAACKASAPTLAKRRRPARHGCPAPTLAAAA